MINFTLYWQMLGKPWCMAGPDPRQDTAGDKLRWQQGEGGWWPWAVSEQRGPRVWWSSSEGKEGFCNWKVSHL